MIKSKAPLEFEPNRTICRHPLATHSPGIFYGKDPLQFSIPLLLLELSMVILITRLVHYVLRPLKQPRIISEILVSIFFSSGFYILHAYLICIDDSEMT